MNIEHVICNGHLPTHGDGVGGRGVGSWMQGVVVGEHFIFTSWLVGAFDLVILACVS